MSQDGEIQATDTNINYKAISCEQIPELFLDKLVAKNHFSKFGKISRFILTPKRLSCTVEYATEEEAERALLNGAIFNGISFRVNYAENKVAHVQNTEEWVDPDVQFELDGMAPSQRGFGSGPTSTAKQSYALMAPKPIAKPPAIKASTIRTDSPQPEVPKIDASLRQELEDILRRPAFTDEDKYRVLDARDKLIRLKTVRQTDIKKAVATRGTCPDMCPEKERLMREFQRQVSAFEMADEHEDSISTICHRKAIKEYSRSSADQEVPLSHELRSESVLQMTMLYLMHRIMDLCDDPQTSLGDWFHFVWDRTRSIRKDITQQELCSLGGVQLVEQCARFHIHCAARLVAEDPSVFDKKINAENLTKCLQTLKYLYHDLRIKGVHCPYEAEFRSYIILLNLGDSNFLWELKQLPEAIQKAPEIKRAIVFYNALQNNNYVKFFAMIKSPETSYLSACILLGYFNKLRLRAMNVIVKAHTRVRQLPLSYLTRVLGFDDEISAMTFFTYHGLQCDEMDDRVMLERMIRPDMEYAMERAMQLVESKRQVSVGECVCGQPLPSPTVFEQHRPHSSFNANGVLKLEAWSADDQLRGDDAITKSEEKPQPPVNGAALPATTAATALSASTTMQNNIFKAPQIAATNSANLLKSAESNLSRVNKPGSNIFGGINAKSSSPIPAAALTNSNSLFQPVKEATSGASLFNVPPASKNGLDNIFQSAPSVNRKEPDNIFQNSIFKPTAEKPTSLATSSVSTNIFGGFKMPDSKPPAAAAISGGSIFGNAAKETANIFQKPQQNSIFGESLVKDNIFKNFQTSTQDIPHGHASFALRPTAAAANDAMEQRKLQLEMEHQIKQQQLEEEKRKLKELENRRLMERQQQEEQLRQQHEMKRQQDLREACIRKSELEQQDIVSSIISQEVQHIAQRELQRYDNLVQASHMQCNDLMADVIVSLVEDLANEEYALMCYDQLLINRYFTRWLQHLRKKKEQRKLMESTPLWVTTDTRAQFAQALEHPCQAGNLEMIRRYRLGQPCDFKQLLQLSQRSPQEAERNQLCFFSQISALLRDKENVAASGLLQQRQYFKFLISIPSDKEELPGFETYINNWLFANVKKAQLETGPFVHGLMHNLALCVRKISGIYPKNEQGDEMRTEGDHSDGVLFILSGQKFQSQARRRLYNLLKCCRNRKQCPLAIIAYNCTGDKQEIAEMLDLDTLEDEELFSNYRIFGNGIRRRHFSFRLNIGEALDFITTKSYAENYADLQALAMQNVLGFLNATLGEELWFRWQESVKQNPVFQKICQNAEYAKGVYHKALQQIAQIIEEDFSDMPEFPEELKEFVPHIQLDSQIPWGLEYFPINWKQSMSRKVLIEFMQKLHLPTLTEAPPLTNVEDLELWILNYASKCLEQDESSALKASHEAIENLVKQLKQPQMQSMAIEQRLAYINYLSILKPIAFGHINATLRLFQQDLKEGFVIYLRKDLKTYQTQPWWLGFKPLDFVSVDYSASGETEAANSLPEKEETNDDSRNILEDIIAKAEETALKAEQNHMTIRQMKSQKAHATETQRIKRSLDESIYRYELSKKIGCYDTSYVDGITQDIDTTIAEVLNHSPETTKKRRCQPERQPSDTVDAVIARAEILIEKVESIARNKHKRKEAAPICWRY